LNSIYRPKCTIPRRDTDALLARYHPWTILTRFAIITLDKSISLSSRVEGTSAVIGRKSLIRGSLFISIFFFFFLAETRFVKENHFLPFHDNMLFAKICCKH